MDNNKSIKLGNFMNLVKNKRTNQYSCNLKKKQIFKFGLTPNQILNIRVFIKAPQNNSKSIITKSKSAISIWKNN